MHDARAHFNAADYQARNVLLDRLFAERGGRSALDIVSQLRIEDYATAVIQRAKITRKLEDLGAVSEGTGRARQSIIAAYKLFSERVERLAAELPLVASHPQGAHPDTERITKIERVIIDPAG